MGSAAGSGELVREWDDNIVERGIQRCPQVVAVVAGAESAEVRGFDEGVQDGGGVDAQLRATPE